MLFAKFVRASMCVAALVACTSSHAAYTAYIYQDGPDVKATGTGSMNFTGLVANYGGSGTAALHPAVGKVTLGVGSSVRTYSVGLTGPASFGTAGDAVANLASGDLVMVVGVIPEISVPDAYVNGAPLSSTAIWNGATLASLGLTTGTTYTWTWGAGPTADSYTLHVGVAPPAATPATPASIPTLSEWGLIGISGLIALFGVGQFRRKR